MTDDQSNAPVEIGARGVASSALKPSGKATFGDKYLDVVSDGAFIDPGMPIEVIRIAGSRIIVRAASEPTRPSDEADIFAV